VTGEERGGGGGGGGGGGVFRFTILIIRIFISPPVSLHVLCNLHKDRCSGIMNTNLCGGNDITDSHLCSG